MASDMRAFMRRSIFLFVAFCFTAFDVSAVAEDARKVTPTVAILGQADTANRADAAKCTALMDLLYTHLLETSLAIVDREDIKRSIAELQNSRLSNDSDLQIGRLVGATAIVAWRHVSLDSGPSIVIKILEVAHGTISALIIHPLRNLDIEQTARDLTQAVVRSGAADKGGDLRLVGIGDFRGKNDQRAEGKALTQSLLHHLQASAAAHPGIQLVARQHLMALRDERTLAASGLSDTAGHLKRILTASYLVGGRWEILRSEETMIVLALVIEDPTGKRYQVKLQAPTRDELFAKADKAMFEALSHDRVHQGGDSKQSRDAEVALLLGAIGEGCDLTYKEIFTPVFSNRLVPVRFNVLSGMYEHLQNFRKWRPEHEAQIIANLERIVLLDPDQHEAKLYLAAFRYQAKAASAEDIQAGHEAVREVFRGAQDERIKLAAAILLWREGELKLSPELTAQLLSAYSLSSMWSIRNGAAWHTYGYDDGLVSRDTALAAARYFLRHAFPVTPKEAHSYSFDYLLRETLTTFGRLAQTDRDVVLADLRSRVPLIAPHFVMSDSCIRVAASSDARQFSSLRRELDELRAGSRSVVKPLDFYSNLLTSILSSPAIKTHIGKESEAFIRDKYEQCVLDGDYATCCDLLLRVLDPVMAGDAIGDRDLLPELTGVIEKLASTTPKDGGWDELTALFAGNSEKAWRYLPQLFELLKASTSDEEKRARIETLVALTIRNGVPERYILKRCPGFYPYIQIRMSTNFPEPFRELQLVLNRFDNTFSWVWDPGLFCEYVVRRVEEVGGASPDFCKACRSAIALGDFAGCIKQIKAGPQSKARWAMKACPYLRDTITTRSWIRGLGRDSNDDLLVLSTDGSIGRVSKGSNRLVPIKTDVDRILLRNRQIVPHLVANRDYIWIPARNGLIQIEKVTGQARRFGKEQGLLSEVVAGLAMVGEQLWVSMEDGSCGYLDIARQHFVGKGGMGKCQGIAADEQGGIWCLEWSSSAPIARYDPVQEMLGAGVGAARGNSGGVAASAAFVVTGHAHDGMGVYYRKENHFLILHLQNQMFRNTQVGLQGNLGMVASLYGTVGFVDVANKKLLAVVVAEKPVNDSIMFDDCCWVVCGNVIYGLDLRPLDTTGTLLAAPKDIPPPSPALASPPGDLTKLAQMGGTQYFSDPRAYAAAVTQFCRSFAAEKIQAKQRAHLATLVARLRELEGLAKAQGPSKSHASIESILRESDSPACQCLLALFFGAPADFANRVVADGEVEVWRIEQAEAYCAKSDLPWLRIYGCELAFAKAFYHRKMHNEAEAGRCEAVAMDKIREWATKGLASDQIVQEPLAAYCELNAGFANKLDKSRKVSLPKAVEMFGDASLLSGDITLRAATYAEACRRMSAASDEEWRGVQNFEPIRHILRLYIVPTHVSPPLSASLFRLGHEQLNLARNDLASFFCTLYDETGTIEGVTLSWYPFACPPFWRRYTGKHPLAHWQACMANLPEQVNRLETRMKTETGEASVVSLREIVSLYERAESVFAGCKTGEWVNSAFPGLAELSRRRLDLVERLLVIGHTDDAFDLAKKVTLTVDLKLMNRLVRIHKDLPASDSRVQQLFARFFLTGTSIGYITAMDKFIEKEVGDPLWRIAYYEKAVERLTVKLHPRWPKTLLQDRANSLRFCEEQLKILAKPAASVGKTQ